MGSTSFPRRFVAVQGSLYLCGTCLLEQAALRNLGGAAANDRCRGGEVSDPTQGATAVETRGPVRRLTAGVRQDRLQRPHQHDIRAGSSSGAVAGDVPAGRGALGRHPRLHSPVEFRQAVFGENSWSTFSFSFATEKAPRIIDTLREVPPAENVAEMQVKKPLLRY